MSAVDNPKLAVLIDADNASASLAKELLEEVAKFGVATVKRAYGDWTSQHLVGWKEALNRHAIQPIQQFAYTRGKNSTDASLIIDAMDLLYADNVDGFCLVSSDSDFTRLATRLRESRKVVYGLGERKTPEAFRAACDRFVFFEVLKRGGGSVDATTREPAPINDVPDLEQSLRQAFDAVSRDNGWATISSVGSYMAKNNPSFDTRLYGFRKLSDMIRKQPFVEVKESTDGNGGPLLAVRLKARGGRDQREGRDGRDTRETRGGRDPAPARGAARGRNGAPASSASTAPRAESARGETDPQSASAFGEDVGEAFDDAARSPVDQSPSAPAREPRPPRRAREPATDRATAEPTSGSAAEPGARPFDDAPTTEAVGSPPDAAIEPGATDRTAASPERSAVIDDDADRTPDDATPAPTRRAPRSRRTGGRAAAAEAKAAAAAGDAGRADASPSDAADTPVSRADAPADGSADDRGSDVDTNAPAPAAMKRPRRKRN